MSSLEIISFSALLFFPAKTNSSFSSCNSAAPSPAGTLNRFHYFKNLLHFPPLVSRSPPAHSRRNFFINYCNVINFRCRIYFTRLLSSCLLQFCSFYFKFRLLYSKVVLLKTPLDLSLITQRLPTCYRHVESLTVHQEYFVLQTLYVSFLKDISTSKPQPANVSVALIND